MKEPVQLAHKFLEFIPRDLEPNTVYVSIRYATAIHTCCCGCGNRVVTPFSPADWRLVFDGRSISLEPSIGNWSFPCRSHYWIRNNRVIWYDDWSDHKINAASKRDTHAHKNSYGTSISPTSTDDGLDRRKKKGLRSKVKSWFGVNNELEQ
jgi:hypothetical protein